MTLDDKSFRTLIEEMPCALFLADTQKQIIYWNPAAERLTGYAPADVIRNGKTCDILRLTDGEGQPICAERCPLDVALRGHDPIEIEARMATKNGRPIPIALAVSPRRDEKGGVTGALCLLRDHAAMASAQERIEELETLSLIDPLTKLGNRLYLEMNLLARLNELRRYGWPFGVIFMDVDNFKNINDAHGHDVGDKVLVSVGKALQSQSRPFDVVGRWGGDEFCAVIVQAGREQLAPIAERYRRVVPTAGVYVPAGVIEATVSVGATLARPEDTVESLYRRADQLMYESKANGRNCVTLKLDE